MLYVSGQFFPGNIFPLPGHNNKKETMIHTTTFRLLLGCCVLFGLLSGCKSLQELSQLNIPTAGFRGATVKGIQSQASGGIVVSLGLRFRFTNPYTLPLRIPEHRFGLKINNKPTAGRLSTQPSFAVSPKSDTLVVYDFILDLNSRRLRQMNVLGRDNRYEFEADVTLDLSDYGISLPGGMGRKTFHLSFADSIRLPLLPVVEPATEAAQLRFLGEMETFDLGVFQQAFTPFIDQLLNAKFEQDMLAPFIAQLQALDCPSGINQSRPCLEMFSSAVVAFINTAFAADPPLRSQLLSDWNALQQELLNAPEAEEPIIDAVIQTFMPGSASSLANLKAQWTTFKESPAQIRYPGPGVTGLLVRVPFVLYNPNEFAIEAPAFFADAQMSSSYHPIRFEAGQAGSQQTAIPPKSRRNMQLLLELNWGEGGGILSLFQGASLTPRLQGSTRVDVGYGPMQIRMDLPLQLKMGE